jgi:hypothetical protein
VVVQGKPQQAHQQTKAHDGAERQPDDAIHFAIRACRLSRSRSSDMGGTPALRPHCCD